jgi:hypothetical protein
MTRRESLPPAYLRVYTFSGLSKEVLMRQRLFTTGPLLLTTGLLCLFTALATSTGHGAAKRGDAPHCQEACLVEHQRHLEKLTRDLEEKRNKFEFQDSVEDAVKEYNRCIEYCREPQPVK